MDYTFPGLDTVLRDITQVMVVRHVELVAMRHARAAAEAQHRRSMDRVGTHAKEEVAQQATVDAVVPHDRARRQCSERAHPQRDVEDARGRDRLAQPQLAAPPEPVAAAMAAAIGPASLACFE